MSLDRKLIPLKFSLTPRTGADRLIRREADRTMRLCRDLGEAGCARSVTVPAMIGIDEEMRSWSLFQILEHNTIVNRRISAQVLFAAGEGPEPDPDFDVKHDVMPTETAGPEQMTDFEKSVERHLELVSALTHLRGGPLADHPVFGPFDGHKWHCMLGVHLLLHRRQAEAVAEIVRTEANRDL
ncbi:hypothetical protein N9I65_03845 [bacterium]|nr:hypothetical protein [bacterium]